MAAQNPKLNNSLQKQIEIEFVQTISDLKGIEEVKIFLKDFFDEDEIETFAKRLAVAYWLKKGRSNENIKDNLKVSNVIISNIQDSINTKGYKLALKKMEAEEWANKWSEKIRRVIKK